MGGNLELFSGENVVVLGRLETEKSVLIKIISGLLYLDNRVINVLRRSVPNLTRKEINNSLEKVLESIGLIQTINPIPSECSGGQRKQIGITRILTMNFSSQAYEEYRSGLVANYTYDLVFNSNAKICDNELGKLGTSTSEVIERE